MTVITTFNKRQNEKQLTFERRLLRDLSLSIIRKRVRISFFPHIPRYHAFEEYCMEVAIEAYLLGGRYSKFGYKGESLLDVKLRSAYDEQCLADSLFDFLMIVPNEISEQEALYDLCQAYISSWWKEGFDKGERRYKLRLS
ncbi:DUF2521 family protein [Ectobacillus sp. sgz5001026]|uniref:DUF2521 family protein n=1 Tax=Ectobacillus sp. sgz5001026 TaxID=3242473 RepID=UPI0036D2BBE9